MTGLKTLAAAAAVTVLAAGAASATTTFATLVDWSGGGTSDGTANAADRTDIDNAIGSTDGAFLSLGLDGWAVFSFGTGFVSPGSVVEVTWGNVNTYPESASLFVGNSHSSGTLDFLGWQSAGTVVNDSAQGGAVIIFSGGPWTYLAILDTSKTNYPTGPSTDGFDVDSVEVTIAPVPLPAGALLLLTGLGALGLRRRA